MKEELKKFFKPTILRIIFPLALVTWQFFYSFKHINLSFLTFLRDYLAAGLGAIAWGNFFIRNLSLILVWIIVALIIYFFFLGWEFISNFIHNLKIRTTYQNKDIAEYKHLLRYSRVTLKTHFISHLCWTGGVVLFFLGFLFMADLVEAFRNTVSQQFFWQMIEGGVGLNPDNPQYLAITFSATIPFWYFYSCLVFFVFREGKIEEEEARIIEEHYSAVTDDSPFE